jgi:hypothetical protein
MRVGAGAVGFHERGRGCVGKRERFFCCVYHVLRYRQQLDYSHAAFGGRIDLYLFFFDLWMNYGWTITLLLITLHLHATGLAKGGGWKDFLGWWERNDWEGGLGRFEATSRHTHKHQVMRSLYIQVSCIFVQAARRTLPRNDSHAWLARSKDRRPGSRKDDVYHHEVWRVPGGW